MTDETRRCALPGCDEPIEQPESGGPPKRYCSSAHRAVARKQRQAARIEATTTETAAAAGSAPTVELPAAAQVTSVDSAESVGGEQDTVAIDLTKAPAAAVAPAEHPAGTPDDAEGAIVGAAARWPLGAFPRSATSPRVPGPRPTASPGKRVLRPERRPLLRSERKAAGVDRRRRAIASIAIASLVIGGGGYVAASAPTAPDPVAQPEVVPQVDAGQWATRANVALASISQQLDDVAKAEDAWNKLPAAQRADPPAAVRALIERKNLLLQQRATLQSQLQTFQALPAAEQDLDAAQSQLTSIERTLAAAPSSSSGNPSMTAAQNDLAAQRDLRAQQRDRSQEEVQSIRSGIARAASEPLPDGGPATKSVLDDVMALVEKRPTPGKQPSSSDHGQQSLALGPRRDSGRERQEVSRAAPPNLTPRASLVDVDRDDPRTASGNSNGRGNGLVGNAVSAVGNTVDQVGRGLLGSGDDSQGGDDTGNRGNDSGNDGARYVDRNTGNDGNDGDPGRGGDRGQGNGHDGGHDGGLVGGLLGGHQGDRNVPGQHRRPGIGNLNELGDLGPQSGVYGHEGQNEQGHGPRKVTPGSTAPGKTTTAPGRTTPGKTVTGKKPSPGKTVTGKKPAPGKTVTGKKPAPGKTVTGKKPAGKTVTGKPGHTTPPKPKPVGKSGRGHNQTQHSKTQHAQHAQSSTTTHTPKGKAARAQSQGSRSGGGGHDRDSGGGNDHGGGHGSGGGHGGHGGH